MKASFCEIQCNRSGAVRHDQMNGKDYVVVPMVMIVEGVLNGSAGPILYPEEELEKFPESWNHKPVVVYHPELNGKPLSACDPDILTVQGVGLIMNSKFEKKEGKAKGKLKAEAWLDPERIDEVDDRISKAVKNNQTLELSTGLFFDMEPAEGEFDGRDYSGIARNYRPDHLAVLPDKVGACSIDDGAGFIRANEMPDSHFLVIGGKRLFQVRGENGEFDEKLIQHAINEIPSAELDGVSDNQRAAMLARAKQMLRKAKKVAANAKAKTEISFDTIREALGRAIRDGAKNSYRWVVDVFPSSFVYEDDGVMYQQDYERDGENVTVTGLPMHVVRRYQYMAANNQTTILYEELKMSKNEMIAALIKTGRWGEGDQTFLTNQSEDSLKHLVDKAEADKKADAKKDELVVPTDKAGVANATAAAATAVQAPKPQNVDEYIAAAPEGIREVLNHGLRAHQTAKQAFIAKISANKRNKYTQAQLEAKSLDDLEALAALAVEETAPAVGAANYAGQGEVVDNAGDEEALPLPTMSFGK